MCYNKTTMDFIKILREEHKEINEIFDLIDMESNLENKKNLIRKLQSIIGPHFKKENEELYPALEKSSDEEMRKMSKIFYSTMKEYAEDFTIVLEKILALTEDMPLDIDEEYKKIKVRIKDRIIIEEVTIFPAYEKIF